MPTFRNNAMKSLFAALVYSCLLGLPMAGHALASGENDSRPSTDLSSSFASGSISSQQVKDLEGNLYGYSYGGRVRSGPDMESSSVVSLREGERIRILENTGIWFDGYIWYRITSRHGEGFHWGGIFCAETDQALEGVFARCDGPSLANAIISDAHGPPHALVLRGDGLALEDGELLSFGMREAATVERLSSAFGVPPDQRDRLEDCGPGALDSVGRDSGFAAYFQDGTFVGWSSIDERTAEGIGFGSTRAELDAAYAVPVEDTSLGAEFHVDGISGVLNSHAPAAQVNSIWAGMTCVMR